MKIFAQVTRKDDLQHRKQGEIYPIIDWAYVLNRNAPSRGVLILSLDQLLLNGIIS